MDVITLAECDGDAKAAGVLSEVPAEQPHSPKKIDFDVEHEEDETEDSDAQAGGKKTKKKLQHPSIAAAADSDGQETAKEKPERKNKRRDKAKDCKTTKPERTSKLDLRCPDYLGLHGSLWLFLLEMRVISILCREALARRIAIRPGGDKERAWRKRRR